MNINNKSVYIYSSLDIELSNLDYLFNHVDKYLLRNAELNLTFNSSIDDIKILELLEHCLNIDKELLKQGINQYIDGNGFTINLDLLILSKEKKLTVDQVEKYIENLQLDCILKDETIIKFNEFDLYIQLTEFKLISPMSVQLILNKKGKSHG